MNNGIDIKYNLMILGFELLLDIFERVIFFNKFVLLLFGEFEEVEEILAFLAGLDLFIL
jgi:hypothetical protein